jgi:hypothetical protein
MPPLYQHPTKRQSYGGVVDGIANIGSSVSDKANSSSMSKDKMIGIVVAFVILTALGIGLTWWCSVRSAKKRGTRKEEERQAAAASEAKQEDYQQVDDDDMHEYHPNNIRFSYKSKRCSEQLLDEEWKHSLGPRQEMDAQLHEHRKSGYVQDTPKRYSKRQSGISMGGESSHNSSPIVIQQIIEHRTSDYMQDTPNADSKRQNERSIVCDRWSHKPLPTVDVDSVEHRKSGYLHEGHNAGMHSYA